MITKSEQNEWAQCEGFTDMPEMLSIMCSTKGEWAIWAVADLIGVGHGTVQRWMYQMDIPRKNRGCGKRRH